MECLTVSYIIFYSNRFVHQVEIRFSPAVDQIQQSCTISTAIGENQLGTLQHYLNTLNKTATLLNQLERYFIQEYRQILQMIIL